MIHTKPNSWQPGSRTSGVRVCMSNKVTGISQSKSCGFNAASRCTEWIPRYKVTSRNGIVDFHAWQVHRTNTGVPLLQLRCDLSAHHMAEYGSGRSPSSMQRTQLGHMSSQRHVRDGFVVPCRHGCDVCRSSRDFQQGNMYADLSTTFVITWVCWRMGTPMVCHAGHCQWLQ